MKVKVTTLDSKAAGDITLADEVFAVAPRADIVARVVNWQLAKRRAVPDHVLADRDRNELVAVVNAEGQPDELWQDGRTT